MAIKDVRRQVLKDAEAAVCSGRERTYGSPKNSFTRIALLWTAHLVNTRSSAPAITAHDVAMMLALMKIARLEASPTHRDSMVDLAGYAACMASLQDHRADAAHKG